MNTCKWHTIGTRDDMILNDRDKILIDKVSEAVPDLISKRLRRQPLPKVSEILASGSQAKQDALSGPGTKGVGPYMGTRGEETYVLPPHSGNSNFGLITS